jgi:hypothetical protein
VEVGGPSGRPSNGAAGRLALLALVTAILVVLAGLFASPASATTTLHPQTRVAAIAEPSGQLVGPHATVLAVQGRERAPDYDSSATGSSVAAEGEAAAGDHIVLGLRNFGLEDTASTVGGRTLLGDENWQATLQDAIANPDTKFTVSLDGLSGSSTYSKVMGAVQNGLTPNATPLNWELARLYQAGRLPTVNFVENGGSSVANPFGGP